MKKFSLISIFILLSVFKISAQTGDGIKYLGDGIYTSQYTGGTGYASLKKMSEKAIRNFKAFSDPKNCTFEIISKVKTPTKLGRNPKATVTFKLFNKDGTLALTSEEKYQQAQTNLGIKEQAMLEIKRLKELLDLEVITQVEFDKKLVSLKKILLEN
jgi:hypothetical protein|tara:strand:+ start:361 stop:831 length:471 start_codon:yes stop_codon:yes gene_type:complete